ncbi:capsular polysaccharide biosynthesis protein [Planomicrobium stackebrandtii]|uniref:Capsular polysaccharide biosynthesis protein n=1 Tax=Planomicrobium stackebrandtii TaxID=253160 RepID=A0ABU0GUG5_9BACL|nr:capsule biosynthesis protein CapA [Planomicrobium stackebrandtii]MDQ0428997.1 capsular polysaccharide biosynthesis protein [Planomicrobium stackebrandtii]
MIGTKAKKQVYQKNNNQFRFAVSISLFLMLAVWAVFAFILDPEYQASSQILIEESAPATVHRAVESNRIDSQIIEAYASFATSSDILRKVAKELELKNSIADLRQKIQVSYTSNSPVLTITVLSEDSQQVVLIANRLSFIFQNEVKKSLKADHISVISQASFEETKAVPIQSGLLLGLFIAAASGFAFSVLIKFIPLAVEGSVKTTNRDLRKKENQMQTVFK